jgi:hypothetical protein
MAAKTRDWSLTLETAEHAIRHLHWGGQRPWLSGIFSIVARAIVERDAVSAAMLQGAARGLAGRATSPPTPVITSGTSTLLATGGAAGSASFITEQRRETTGLLRETLGEARLAELRAQGEAMDEDHAVAYALDAIARVRQLEAQRQTATGHLRDEGSPPITGR